MTLLVVGPAILVDTISNFGRIGGLFKVVASLEAIGILTVILGVN
jgi:hypothetical protein